MKLSAIISVTALSLTLIGCGSSSSGGSSDLCLNAAQNFELPLETFVVADNMPRTSSWDYLQGIQPTIPDSDISGMVLLMSELVDQFAIYDGEPTGIISLDNAIDTMENTLSSPDTGGNIEAGKIQIESAIRNGVTCSYNNKAAVLRDVSNSNPATNLLYYILDYSYISTSDRLSVTVANYVNVTTGTGINETTTAEIISTSLSALDPSTFVTSGYNAPLATTIQWGDSEESLTIIKNYQDQRDISAYVSATPFTVNGDATIKRFKISIDYQTLAADIFVSDFVSAVTCHADTVNEVVLKDPSVQDLIDNNCENLEDRQSYQDPGYDTTRYPAPEEGDPVIPDLEPVPLYSYDGSLVSTRQ